MEDIYIKIVNELERLDNVPVSELNTELSKLRMHFNDWEAFADISLRSVPLEPYREGYEKRKKMVDGEEYMSYKDFQILVPIYKGLHGIDAINKEMQSIFNPKDSHKKEINIGETLFREEDKVIQLTNQPEDNIYNGDIGIISRIVTSPKKEIYIDFDNNLVKYTPTNFSNFLYSILLYPFTKGIITTLNSDPCDL